jgi:7-carboxy-7-deazaguanine synthase (Cx14CxxC type)
MYSVKEIFYTLQGEGFHAGRPAVFCRFAGCNLWSGRETERATAVCNFCDTDFVGTNGEGGGRFPDAATLAQAIAAKWPETRAGAPFVVLTGGEPLLQLDAALIDALHVEDFVIAVETNGTLLAPTGLNWICVSPKGKAPVVQRSGDELKLVYPQAALDPSHFADWEFRHFFLQPMDGPNLQDNVRASVDYCLANPRWQLSLQTHKIIGIR